jgi:adenylate cyclase
MAQEIERKFLLVSDDWKEHVSRSDFYRQGYLSGTEKCSIRVRTANDNAYLNIKSATLGIQRTEYEYEIPLVDANKMLNQFCHGAVIEKTRYFVPYKDHLWEVDVFEGLNQGLVVAEIELDSVEEKFAIPEWIGAEVSDDLRYYNVCLVDHPFCDWEA